MRSNGPAASSGRGFDAITLGFSCGIVLFLRVIKHGYSIERVGSVPPYTVFAGIDPIETITCSIVGDASAANLICRCHNIVGIGS